VDVQHRGVVGELPDAKTRPQGRVFAFGVRGSQRGTAGRQVRGVSGGRRWDEMQLTKNVVISINLWLRAVALHGKTSPL